MEVVSISLGFNVEVDDFGNITLPDRPFTSAQLKKIAREVDKAMRLAAKNEEIGGCEEYE